MRMPVIASCVALLWLGGCGDDDSTVNNNNEAGDAQVLCGNDTVDPPEVCDGADLSGWTCASVDASFLGGTLLCNATCDGWVTTGCTSAPVCGDGVAVAPEVCDASDVAGETCATVDASFVGGTLGCNTTCDAWDTSLCIGDTCGNSVVDAPELCDGSDLAGNDCVTLGGFSGGVLSCASTCDAWDTSLCIVDNCGNGVIDLAEVCDASDLGGNDCTTIGLGFTGGVLGCNATCDGWDTTLCTGTSVCGDGTLETVEKCDDGDLSNGDGCNPTCDLYGLVTTVAGDAGTAGSNNGTGFGARFDTPSGIATDGQFVWIADTANCGIRQVDLSTWIVTTLAGNLGHCGHNDGTGNAVRFDTPQGLVYWGNSLYVADTNNHVIREVNVSNGSVVTVAGLPGVAGSGDGIGAAAEFNEPRGIATDGSHLYVADFANNTIRMVDLGTWAVTTLAGEAGVSGTSDGVGAAAHFDHPRGVLAGGPYVYVADTGNSTLRQIHLMSQVVATVAGTPGMPGSVDGVGGAARFSSPRGLAMDAQSVYVADHGNNTVRQVLVGTWDVSTLCGQAGVAGTTDGTGIGATMTGPWGIVLDPLMAPQVLRLYFVESGSHILRTID